MVPDALPAGLARAALAELQRAEWGGAADGALRAGWECLWSVVEIRGSEGPETLRDQTEGLERPRSQERNADEEDVRVKHLRSDTAPAGSSAWT